MIHMNAPNEIPQGLGLLKLTTACLLFSLAVVTVNAQQATKAGTQPAALPIDQKPNVVLILADNVGYGDLGPYGDGGRPLLARVRSETDRSLTFKPGIRAVADPKPVPRELKAHCRIPSAGSRVLGREDEQLFRFSYLC